MDSMNVYGGGVQTASAASAPTTEVEGVKCPKCGTVITGKFCTECGTPRPEEPAAETTDEKFCPNCGAKVPADAKFCTECGASLQD